MLQDPVVRVPKGGYKKAGSGVIINALGDLIVRPNFLEVQQVFRGGELGAGPRTGRELGTMAGSSLRPTQPAPAPSCVSSAAAAGVVGHHAMGSYRAALAAIAKSQFSPRRLSDGEAGAAALAEGLYLDRVLLCSGMDLYSLRDPACQPVFRAGQRKWEEKVSAAAAHPLAGSRRTHAGSHASCPGWVPCRIPLSRSLACSPSSWAAGCATAGSCPIPEWSTSRAGY